METTPVLSPDQLNSPTAIADPYPFYRQLRDQSPVNYIHLPGGIFPGIDEPVRAWALMRYDDIYGALRDHDTFSSERNPLIEKGFFPPLVLITNDPPRHTRFRRLVNKAFTLKRIETLGPWIASIANNLLDEIGVGEGEHSAILTDQWESFYAKDSAALGARVLDRSPAPSRRGASYGSCGNCVGRGAGAETTSRVSPAIACLF